MKKIILKIRNFFKYTEEDKNNMIYNFIIENDETIVNNLFDKCIKQWKLKT